MQYAILRPSCDVRLENFSDGVSQKKELENILTSFYTPLYIYIYIYIVQTQELGYLVI